MISKLDELTPIKHISHVGTQPNTLPTTFTAGTNTASQGEAKLTKMRQLIRLSTSTLAQH